MSEYPDTNGMAEEYVTSGMTTLAMCHEWWLSGGQWLVATYINSEPMWDQNIGIVAMLAW